MWQQLLDQSTADLGVRRLIPRTGRGRLHRLRAPGIRLELAFLACDEAGTVYTPLMGGRGDWPVGSFGETQAEVDGLRPVSSVSRR
jgi:hypothetical protein